MNFVSTIAVISIFTGGYDGQNLLQTVEKYGRLTVYEGKSCDDRHDLDLFLCRHKIGPLVTDGSNVDAQIRYHPRRNVLEKSKGLN